MEIKKIDSDTGDVQEFTPEQIKQLQEQMFKIGQMGKAKVKGGNKKHMSNATKKSRMKMAKASRKRNRKK